MPHFSKTITLAIVGSDNLYHAVRAGFVNQGTTFNKWCVENGFCRQTVEKALKGKTNGKRSKEWCQCALSAAIPHVSQSKAIAIKE